MRLAIIAAALLAALPGGAFGQTTSIDLATKAEGRAWCQGYQIVIAEVRRNRDHFMRLSPGFKFETSEDAMKRIHATPWEDQHKTGDIVHQLIGVERDAVDLYVVPPLQKLLLSTKEGDVICAPIDLSKMTWTLTIVPEK